MSVKRLAECDSRQPEEVEHALLAALYPLRGGATLGTLATTVASHGLRQVALAEALGRLVASSLVTVHTAGGVARYQIQEGERAAIGREGWLRDRLHDSARWHLRWCERLLAGAEDALVCGPAQKSWLERIALERANLSPGVGLALRNGNLALAGRLAAEMCSFWEMRGPFREAQSLISRVLGAGPLAAGTRACLLDGLGRLMLRQGRYAAACRALRQALALAEAEGEQLVVARVGARLGLAELCSGNRELAAGAVEHALAELVQLDSPADLARGYATRALLALAQGRTGEALADLDRSLALQVGAADLVGWATGLLYLSLAHLASEDLDGATEDARKAAGVFTDLGDQGGTSTCLMVAATALSAGRPDAAFELAELSARFRRESGALPLPGLNEMAEAALARARRSKGGQAARLAPRQASPEPLDALARALAPCAQRGDGEATWASVTALGGFQVLRDGRVAHLPPQVARLVKLLVTGGGQVHVEQAVESLWPEVGPVLGKRRLRNVLSKLSHATGPLVLREASTLRLAPGVAVDALRFESAARHALGVVSTGGGDGGVAMALAVHRSYTGELLPEDRYEDFAIVARERLGWLHLRLLDAAARAAAAAHDDRTAEHLLRAALDIDPTDEDRYVALARHMANRGCLAAASHILVEARALLTRLGFPVSPALLGLEEAVRARAPGP